MTASTERPMAAVPLRPNLGNWRNQLDAQLTPVERELRGRLLKAQQEVDEIQEELAQIKAIKRQAGVETEI